MRVLLVSVNRCSVPYPVYPLGLDYVAASIAPGHRATLLDLRVDEPEPALAQAIAEVKPQVVGVSIRNIDNTDVSNRLHFVEEARSAVEAIRQATDAVVVLGGAGFTLFPAELMARIGADYGIVGEGERLAPLLDALESGQDGRSLPGVVVNDEAHAVRWPEPWRGAFDRVLPSAEGVAGDYIRTGGMLNLQTKRGCPHRCIYCTYPLIEGTRIRRFEPREVARTARALQDAGARYLYITDSVFNADIEHNLAVADALISAGVSVPWGAFFAPVAVPDDYYPRLVEAGLSHVEFGTESLSPPVLRAYRKAFTVDGVLEAHRAACAAGAYVAHYFVLGGPGETPETVAETLDRVESLSKSVFFFFCGMRIYPNTPLAAYAYKQGQLDPDRSLLEPVYYHAPGLTPEALVATVRERAKGRRGWIVGSGGPQTARLIARRYARGYSGPLWENLI